jgi:hypothetical protein
MEGRQVVASKTVTVARPKGNSVRKIDFLGHKK